MTQGSYGQFCPVAMAAEVLCRRWTMVLLRELIAGSTRFNDLQRGVPRMSPALLSQRLKELETAGLAASSSPSLRRSECGAGAGSRCRTLATASGRVPAHVGHAAQPRSNTAASAAQCRPVPLSGPVASAAYVVASRRT